MKGGSKAPVASLSFGLGHLLRIRPISFLREPTWPRYAYPPFGAGPRACIGQSVGLAEARLIIATVLQRWRPVDVAGTVVPDPKFSLRPRGGLPMTWRKPAKDV